jgi:hypothetical protein
VIDIPRRDIHLINVSKKCVCVCVHCKVCSNKGRVRGLGGGEGVGVGVKFGINFAHSGSMKNPSFTGFSKLPSELHTVLAPNPLLSFKV